MFGTKSSVTIAISLVGVLLASKAHAESADNNSEIALLRQQLRALEQKLDKLQRQSDAIATSAAKSNAKPSDAKAGVSVTTANAAYPIKSVIERPMATAKMPGNRPTICTADELNCVGITGRFHFERGGYDYRPNSAATDPQRLDSGVNARRAR